MKAGVPSGLNYNQFVQRFLFGGHIARTLGGGIGGEITQKLQPFEHVPSLLPHIL